MKATIKYIAFAVVALWAVVCFVFFQWFYLYHLVYRMQVQLFLYSSDYLSFYFLHPAWLACLSGDFVTQFFYFNYGGALTITLSLLLLGGVWYVALGNFHFNFFHRSKQSEGTWIWVRILFSLVLMTWEALRNCGLDYELSSTISLIGGILLFLPYAVCLQRWRWMLGLMLLPLSYWLFGYGVWAFMLLAVAYEIKSHRYLLALLLAIVSLVTPALLRQQYHLTWHQAYQYPTNSFFNKPNFTHEKLLMMDVESSFGHWNKIAQLTEKEDLQLSTSTYFYNLSHAMQGRLPLQLMNEYQPGPLGLLIPLNPSSSMLSIWASNEVWFQLGDMTMAEHSALLGQIFSPNHRSSRMVMRLAEINLINNDSQAAMKYLRLLQKTWLYKDWAEQRIPGKETKMVKNWLEQKRALLPVQDTLRAAYDYTFSLRALLNSHPDNSMALDYLLCYDLLSKDINAFMADYNLYKNVGKEIPNRLYSEALLIGLTKCHASLEEVKHYYIQPEVVNDFNEYTNQYEASKGNGSTLQNHYGKTYWFYYHFATFK